MRRRDKLARLAAEKALRAENVALKAKIAGMVTMGVDVATGKDKTVYAKVPKPAKKPKAKKPATVKAKVIGEFPAHITPPVPAKPENPTALPATAHSRG